MILLSGEETGFVKDVIAVIVAKQRDKDVRMKVLSVIIISVAVRDLAECGPVIVQITVFLQRQQQVLPQ
jgi:hypothetical protein